MTDSPAAVATLNWAPFVYGENGPALDDPAERYHEASKLSPVVADHGVPGRLLSGSGPLRISAARAVKLHSQAPLRSLPRPGMGAVTLAAALQRRRSSRAFATESLALAELAELLHAGYGVTSRDEAQPLRAAPSGGGLYPLDLYPVVNAVDGLDPGVYHYDPFRHRLEELRAADMSTALARCTVYPDLLERAGAVVFLGAMFWRSRFKYGLRAYRFALLEAGHVAQNFLLGAAALELAAVPVGGFYDRLVDDLLGLDGVNESVVYALAVGRAAE